MKENFKVNYHLDITDEVCPMTFVKTKLMLEKMKPNEIIEVRLPDGEPLKNVPRSVEEQGDKIINLEKDPKHTGVYLLQIMKTSK